MKSTDSLSKFGTLIGASASSADITTIPATQATAGDGTASIALAFPPETFIARSAGGEPPRGADMNGFLNLLSAAIQPIQAGYLGSYDADFAASIGGYPLNAIVSGSSVGTFWVSTEESNTTVPGASGASWQSLFNGLQDALGFTPVQQGATASDTQMGQNKVNIGWDVTGSYRLRYYVDGGATGNALIATMGDVQTLDTAIGSEAASRANADAAIIAMLGSYLPLAGGNMTGGIMQGLDSGVDAVNALGSTGDSNGDTVGPRFYSRCYTDATSIAGAAFNVSNIAGAGLFATIMLTDGKGSYNQLRYGKDDRLRTSAGNVFALTTELPTSSITTDSNGNPVIIETVGGVKTQSFIAINLVDKETITYPEAFSGLPTVQLTPIYGASIGTGGSTILANLATTPGDSSFQIDLRAIGAENEAVTTGTVVHVMAKGPA